jgi:hypothetical protein
MQLRGDKKYIQNFGEEAHENPSLKEMTKKSKDNITLDLMETGCEDGLSMELHSNLVCVNGTETLDAIIIKFIA